MQEEARIDLLQSMPLFGGVDANTVRTLLAVCPVVSVAANDFFFREYDEADAMFVLEFGKAVVLKSWYGKDYALHTLKVGDCFGEMAIMDRCPRSASVRAAEDRSAIRISPANLHQIYVQDLKQFALIQMNMGREVCRRLRDANQRLFGAKMGVPETEGHVFLAA
jgi:CRP/FNR family cyclic AMP-dependent transcriptional regulator